MLIFSVSFQIDQIAPKGEEKKEQKKKSKRAVGWMGFYSLWGGHREGLCAGANLGGAEGGNLARGVWVESGLGVGGWRAGDGVVTGVGWLTGRSVWWEGGGRRADWQITC